MRSWRPSIWIVLLCAAICSYTPPKASAAPKKVFDLGEGEFVGNVKRPSLKWVDSSAAMKKLLPRIHRERFKKLEEELLKPLDRKAWLARHQVSMEKKKQ